MQTPPDLYPSSLLDWHGYYIAVIGIMSATSRRWELEGITADKKIMPTTAWAERMAHYNNKRARQSG